MIHLKRSDEKTFKQVLLVLIGALSFILAVSYSQNAGAVGLKGNGLIEKDVIMLSDIFHSLPEHKDKVLGPAPQPGKDMTLSARTLLRVAMALDLSWRPSSGAEHIVLSRAATLVSHDDITHVIRNAVIKDGFPGSFMITTDQKTQIILPPDMPKTAVMDTIDVDMALGRFDGTLVAPSAENPVQRLRVRGKIEPTTHVPILSHTVRNGTIITANNIETVEIPTKSLSSQVIIDANALLGSTPRRMISAGQPIKVNDIQAPQVVERGEIVTMIFKRGPLQLTAQGKAMENGAKGDMIRVINTGSNQSIQGTISNPREIIVTSF